MFGSKVVWGVDLGESAVRAVKLKTDKSGAQILALDSVSRVMRAEGYSYIDKSEQLRNALSTLVARNKFGSSRVAISAPGTGFDKFISLPAVSMKQVPQIVRYEARQQIPFPLDEVAWAYQLASEHQVPGEGIEVALFAIKNQIIEDTLANLAVAGLGVDIIGMGHLGLYNLLKFDQQVEDNTLIVDVGAGSTDIVILAEGNFRVRSIPISGEAVTKMLQQKFGIAYEEAEELKKKASQSKQPEKLFNVMRPTFDRLLSEIHKTIGYYRQQFKSLKIEKAYLLGQSFKMQPLVDMFAESLDCKVSTLGSYQRVSLSPELAGSPHANELPSFAVAIGLALQASGAGPITINVLPEEMQAQREIGRKKPFAAATAACFGAGLLASFITVNADNSRISALDDKPENLIKQQNELINRFNEAQDTAEVSERIAGLAGIGENREVMLTALNAVTDIFGTTEKPKVPIDIFLDDIEMKVQRPVPGQQPTYDELGEAIPVPAETRTLVIRGWTEKTGEFVHEQLVEALRQVKIFRNVKAGVTPLVKDGAEAKLRNQFVIEINVAPAETGQESEGGN